MCRLIIFDVDGTLFDTKKGIISALNYVLNQFGEKKIPVNEQDKYIGPSVREALKKYNGFSSEKVEEATSLYREVYVQKYISQSEPYPCLEEVMTALQTKGFEIGIATMKTKGQVDRLLEVFNLTDVFEIVKAAREDGTLSKTQMLIDICNDFETGQSEVYMVGDTQGDYEAARAAGCRFIAADYGYGHIHDELEVKHISELNDVLNILG